MLLMMIAAFLLAAVLGYGAYHPSTVVWAISNGADLSPEGRVAWIVWGVAALLVTGLVADPARARRFLPRIRSLGPWSPLAFGALAGLLFFLLRSHNHFLGDGWLLVTFLERVSDVIPHRPGMGTLWLQRLQFLLVRRVGADPETSLALFACVLGAGYVAIALAWARSFGEELRGKSRGAGLLLAGALLTAGSMQLFFGYVENYALVHVLLLAYLVEGALSLMRGRTPFFALLLFAAACFSHWAAFIFFPSVVMLLLGWVRGRDPSRALFRRIPEACVALLFVVPPTLSQLQIRRMPVPWVSRPGVMSAGMFSPEQFLHILNLAFLLVPAAALLLLVPRSREGRGEPADRATRFFRIAALSGIAFALVMRPFLGPRDWDLFSFFAPPFALWAGLRAFGRLDDRRVLPVGALVALVGVFTLAPWVLGNRTVERGARRVTRMVWDDPNHFRGAKPAAASLAWVMVERGAGEQGFELLRHTTDVRPDDAVAQANLGILYFQRGEYDLAKPHLAEAVKLRPGLSQPIYYLGATEFMLKKTDLGEAAFREYLLRDSENPSAESYLGRILMWRGEWGEALGHLMIARRVLPKEPDLNGWIARTLSELGRWTEALEYVDRSLAVDPHNDTALRVRQRFAEAASRGEITGSEPSGGR